MKKLFFATIFLLTSFLCYSQELDFFSYPYSNDQIEAIFKSNNIEYEILENNEYKLYTAFMVFEKYTYKNHHINSISVGNYGSTYQVVYFLDTGEEECVLSDIILDIVKGNDLSLIYWKEKKCFAAYDNKSKFFFSTAVIDVEIVKINNFKIEMFISLDK